MLPPISTSGLKASDVDNLAQSTRESMFKTLVEMADYEKADGAKLQLGGASTAVEIWFTSPWESSDATSTMRTGFPD